MKRYVIEVSSKGIVKKFIDGKNTYKEKWIRTKSGSMETSGKCITSQLEDANEDCDSELIELLEQDDLEGLWTYFEENPEEYESKGKFIKNLATCSNCKLDLISKWDSGIWGFSRIMRDENNNFYTKCPMCDSNEKYSISTEDINFKPKEMMK